jgi:hypothetical protein
MLNFLLVAASVVQNKWKLFLHFKLLKTQVRMCVCVSDEQGSV